jgi:hypothetical protein
MVSPCGGVPGEIEDGELGELGEVGELLRGGVRGILRVHSGWARASRTSDHWVRARCGPSLFTLLCRESVRTGYPDAGISKAQNRNHDQQHVRQRRRKAHQNQQDRRQAKQHSGRSSRQPRRRGPLRETGVSAILRCCRSGRLMTTHRIDPATCACTCAITSCCSCTVFGQLVFCRGDITTFADCL